MPASDFGWSNRAQVFQVFGNKRKHEWTEAGDREVQMEASSKRQCPEPTECGDAMNEMLEINHNSILPTDAPQQDTAPVDCATMTQDQIHQLQHAQLQQQIQEQQQQQQQYMQQQQQHLQSQQMQQAFNQEIQPQQQQEDPQSHNTMVMDLCDETYSNAQLDTETQSMYSNMDSDFVPNLQQYGLAFCGDSCLGGERYPASGRIRCYCKQSWEGLMDMRPYVSDYY
ncbi:uncharacterized protein [Haliotis cracherodii]|uniref:uncharacterized protein isoform X1 n=2 Tax=Haliotis cracherodii TaxID=6455 RepID=UPI0039E86062